jgi:hypothetical protein
LEFDLRVTGLSEKDFSREFVLLTKKLHPVRIENALTTLGLPDLNISTGWIELKWHKTWPAKESTPLRLPHYTDEQRNWLMKRWNAGGKAWLALKVRSEWFNCEAPAAQRVGHLTHQELIETATAYFPVKPTSEQLCEVFTRTFD